ncbi:MAG: NTP transferase domain-containing protein [Bacteroidetes bacterium]|nr:NTP transferase domain-containing protein [Bacteroidota bacterium]
MNIIIPMAGMGKRMRPHTLTVPKPLLPIAGKPIVQRLVEDIAAVCNEPINEVAFVIGNFGEAVELQLLQIAESVGAKGRIYYQDEALGTAHAVMCATPALTGEVIIAFADTLFKAQFELDKSKDGTIWVHKVANPSQFGVVKLDENNVITDFIEKPVEFITDLAIIGIYYFKDGDNLLDEIQYLIDNNVTEKGEYQLTNALENMKNKGLQFIPGEVEEWLDCGNKDATVYTNQRILEIKKDELTVDFSQYNHGTKIIEPCYIGNDVVIENCTIGPHVSIGNGTVIKNSTIENSIIQNNCTISQAHFKNSMIGNFVTINGESKEYSIGDYSTLN